MFIPIVNIRTINVTLIIMSVAFRNPAVNFCIPTTNPIPRQTNGKIVINSFLSLFIFHSAFDYIQCGANGPFSGCKFFGNRKLPTQLTLFYLSWFL